MKKTSIIFSVLMSLSVWKTNASVSIDFRNNPLPSSQSLFTDSAETNRVPVGTWTTELIFSSDNIAGAINPSDPFTPTGGDLVLATLTPSHSAGRILSSDYSDKGFPATTTQTYLESTYSYGGSFVNGYVYARMFNTTNSGTATMYTQTPITALAGSDVSPLGYYYNNSYFDTAITVPEPGTVGLLLVGLAVIGLRRKIVA